MLDLTELISENPRTDTAMVLTEIMYWANSLVGDIEDDVVLNTLEGVVDIIIDNLEE